MRGKFLFTAVVKISMPAKITATNPQKPRSFFLILINEDPGSPLVAEMLKAEVAYTMTAPRQRVSSNFTNVFAAITHTSGTPLGRAAMLCERARRRTRDRP